MTPESVAPQIMDFCLDDAPPDSLDLLRLAGYRLVPVRPAWRHRLRRTMKRLCVRLRVPILGRRYWPLVRACGPERARL